MLLTQSNVSNSKYVLSFPADGSKANKQARDVAARTLTLWVELLKNKFGTLSCTEELQECDRLLDNYDNS